MTDLKARVENALTANFVTGLYKEVDKQTNMDSGWIKGLCPFHKEEQSSFNFNPSQVGRYNCHSCGVTGNIYTYIREIKKEDKPLKWLSKELGITIAKIREEERIEMGIPKVEVKEPIQTKKTVPTIKIREAKTLLMDSPNKKKVLVDFGISEEVINKFNLGYKDNRYWIPIKDNAGDYVDVRKYDPFNAGTNKVLGFGRGFGAAKLYPLEALNENTLYLMEGEKDVLIARSLGLNAMTNTNGVNAWKKEWAEQFTNKNVIICLDVDAPGRQGARKRALSIIQYAAQVKIINLPLDIKEFPTGDFANYIEKGHTLQDFYTLIKETIVFTAEAITDDTEYKCILGEASKASLINKKCFIQNVLCCGKDTSPFGAPKRIEATCVSINTSDKKCKECSVSDSKTEKLIEKDNTVLLTFIRENDSIKINKIKRLMKIPTDCFKCKINIVEYYNIEKLRIVPDITYNIEETFDHVYRTAYFITDDDTKIETNKTYNIKAVTCLDSKTQYIQHQIYELDYSNIDLDKFVLTKDIIHKLNKFQQQDSITSTLNKIYNDYSNIASIYGRNDLFFLMDLVFFSPLTFNFQGRSIGKGWVEAIAVGDSGVGKSSIAKFLCKHYKAGEFISGESNSYSGLVGGLSQMGGQWQLQWGRLPLNDRRLVVIDEASGMPCEDIAKLSEIRSTGEAKIQKIISEATRARTRIIWIANPRKSNLGIKNYNYGVFTLKEIFGQPEDLRRVDIGMTVASGEVEIQQVNTVNKDHISEFDSDSCHHLLMFAWSRKREDISISKETETKVLEVSQKLVEKYSSAIPLVEKGDIRNKIIRLSVSLAVRLFSVDAEQTVIVKPEHVEHIFNFIQKLYDKPRFSYNEFSREELRKTTLIDKKEIADILGLYNLEELQDYSFPHMSKKALYDIIEDHNILVGQDHISHKQLRIYLKKLKRNNAIIDKDKNITFTPALLDFLRELRVKYENGESYEEIFNNELDLE